MSLSHKGKCHSLETKEKMSKSHKGKVFTEEHKRKIGLANSFSLTGRTMSEETRRKMSIARSGEKNWKWKGGCELVLSRKIRKCFEYSDWRRKILIRDNHTCQECRTTKNPQVHHIKRFLVILKEYNIKTVEQAIECQELWDINNGITYCKDCHRYIENQDRLKRKIARSNSYNLFVLYLLNLVE